MPTTQMNPILTDVARRRAAPARPSFTDRQLQVLRMLAAGYSYDEAGAALGITGRTIKAHERTLAVKLGCSRRRHVPLRFMALTGRNPFPQGGEPL